MSRIKYYYDTEKCKYERVKTSVWDVALNILGFISLSILVGGGLAYTIFRVFPSPQVVELKMEVAEYKSNFETMHKQIDDLFEMNDYLFEKDRGIYRVLTGAEDRQPTFFGKGGSKRFEVGNTESKILISETYSQLEKLGSRMAAQSKSYTELIELAKQKDDFNSSIPAIQPVSKSNQKVRLASGYGMRLHPILGKRRMHWGLDFAAPIGTPIYATGDATVEQVEMSFGGYGKQVILNHGFGYKTRYAHMSKYIVKNGEKVKRGQIIGYVGNTGRSTGPHLHYEIFHRGEHVDPINYLFRDLNPEEYEEILKQASIENESLS